MKFLSNLVGEMKKIEKSVDKDPKSWYTSKVIDAGMAELADAQD